VTAAAVEAPRRAFAEASSCAAPGGGRVTLEERLQAAWRRLHAESVAECPVCGSEMALHAGVGECGGCGAKMR
jgi:hypothetical protein